LIILTNHQKDLIILPGYCSASCLLFKNFTNLPGNVRNTGVEVGLNFAAIQGKSFTWDISYNMTFIKNDA
jgi:hypothetical protein